MSTRESKTVMTVTGPVFAEELGFTQIHEHLFARPNSSEIDPDLILDDFQKARKEIEIFKAAGGGTIVDAGVVGWGRDPESCRKVSEVTGINIIMTTGFYKDEFLPQWALNSDEDSLTGFMLKELREGIGDTGVFPGVIKVALSSTERFSKIEEKLLHSAAKTHLESGGTPVNVHCEQGKNGVQTLRLFERLGVGVNRVALSHIDLNLSFSYYQELLEMGALLSFDHIAHHGRPDEFYIPILHQIRNRYGVDQLLFSLDLGRKSYWKSYGGKIGLDYLLTSFLPHLKIAGFSEEELYRIMVLNPAKYLAGA